MDIFSFGVGFIMGGAFAYLFYLGYEYEKTKSIKREQQMIENVAKTLKDMELNRRK